MKKIFLVLALIASAPSVWATGGVNGAQMLLAPSAYANANSIATADAKASALGIGGNSDASSNITNGVNVKTKNIVLPGAAAMGAMSTNTTSSDRYPEQHTVTTILGGWTTITSELDIVKFVGRDTTEDEQLAACVQSAQYRKFRELKKQACPALK